MRGHSARGDSRSVSAWSAAIAPFMRRSRKRFVRAARTVKFGSHPASAFVATVTLIAFVATLIGGPMRLAHAVEEVEPADTPNFSDSSNGVRSGADVASSTQKSAKARKAPVSARGSFVHSLSISAA